MGENAFRKPLFVYVYRSDDHLALDLLVATAFMLLPYVLMLDGLDAAYYYANAAVVYLVVALTSTAKLTSK